MKTVRKAMIEAQVLMTYRRDLNNLSIQEAACAVSTKRNEAELKRLLAERKAAAEKVAQEEKKRWNKAIRLYQSGKQHGLAFDPAEIGFEFSTEEIADREWQIHQQAIIDTGRYYEYKAERYLKPPQSRLAIAETWLALVARSLWPPCRDWSRHLLSAARPLGRSLPRASRRLTGGHRLNDNSDNFHRG
jgi:hypothetical protein